MTTGHLSARLPQSLSQHTIQWASHCARLHKSCRNPHPAWCQHTTLEVLHPSTCYCGNPAYDKLLQWQKTRCNARRCNSYRPKHGHSVWYESTFSLDCWQCYWPYSCQHYSQQASQQGRQPRLAEHCHCQWHPMPALLSDAVVVWTFTSPCRQLQVASLMGRPLRGWMARQLWPFAIFTHPSATAQQATGNTHCGHGMR